MNPLLVIEDRRINEGLVRFISTGEALAQSMLARDDMNVDRGTMSAREDTVQESLRQGADRSDSGTVDMFVQKGDQLRAIRVSESMFHI
jgi:hypothetical protein